MREIMMKMRISNKNKNLVVRVGIRLIILESTETLNWSRYFTG